MPTIRTTLFFFLLSTFFLAPSRSDRDDASPSSAYQILQDFGFPRGILPEGVQSYVLRQDGSFEVLFDKDCKFGIQGSYSLSYRRKITGKLQFGSLKELQGVSVKVVFVWLPISEVDCRGGVLDFYVGPLSASFPLNNFDESPRCGCGFDCHDKLVSDA